jgi:hypothetical protein
LAPPGRPNTKSTPSASNALTSASEPIISNSSVNHHFGSNHRLPVLQINYNIIATSPNLQN